VVSHTGGVSVVTLGPSGRLPLEFLVPGVPVSAQTRRRLLKDQWMESVRASASVAWGSAGPVGDELAVALTLYARAGWRLDLDNMAKPILDAMTSLVWDDDRQIVSLYAHRRDLGGPLIVAGVSPVLAQGFVSNSPFVHVRVTEPPDMAVIP
jgi:Holliday junction resolvase RusA-like endonuclease